MYALSTLRQRRPSADPGWYPSGGIKRRWQTIVIHHSASSRDTPAGMDAYHRNTRGWKNGLGYHFVIGNGVNTADGKVYVGNEDGIMTILPATKELDEDAIVEVDMYSPIYASAVAANGTVYVASHTHLFAIAYPDNK